MSQPSILHRLCALFGGRREPPARHSPPPGQEPPLSHEPTARKRLSMSSGRRSTKTPSPTHRKADGT